jgi:hypothetical protein
LEEEEGLRSSKRGYIEKARTTGTVARASAPALAKRKASIACLYALGQHFLFCE